MCPRFFSLLLAAGVGCLGQAPAIFQNGVTQAAGRLPMVLPGAVLAPGSRVHIRGIRLQPGRFEVTVESRGGTQRARVVAVTESTAEAILPAGLADGEAKLRVSRDGEWSNPAALRIGKQSLGLYSRNGLGWGPGSFAAGAIARPGDLLRLRVEAIGSGTTVQVHVGNLDVPGTLSGGQLVFRLPLSAQAGCYVPVSASTVHGEVTSNVVSLTVLRGPGPCEVHSGWPRPVPKAGLIFLQRIDYLSDLQPVDLGQGIEEGGFASFFRLPEGRLLSLHVMPPVGSCAGATYEYLFRNATTGRFLTEMTQASAITLDAGAAFQVVAASGPIELRPRGNGIYGGSFSHKQVKVFETGAVRVTGLGGKDVGPFEISVAVEANLEWKNRDESMELRRERGHLLEWRGADESRPVIIVGFGVDRQSTAAWDFICAAPAGTRSFQIPKHILANLPFAPAGGEIPIGALALFQPRSSAFTARGIDAGTVLYAPMMMRAFFWR